MSAPMRLAIAGATGRMGRELVKACLLSEQTTLCAAIARPGHALLGQDAGVLAGLPACGVLLSDDMDALSLADGVIDFTSPDLSLALAEKCAARGIVHVVGTTGLSTEQLAALRNASSRCALIQSGNMSLGVNVLAALVRKAAHILGDDFDIEVLEMHHKAKVDAPSGTALLLGNAAAQARNVHLDQAGVFARHGVTGARRKGSIGFATLRGGSVIGEHTVYLAGAGERIALSHSAEDRGLFARGAIKAALWGRTQKPGYYTMEDVLGLRNI